MPKNEGLSIAQAQEGFLKYRAKGMTVEEAMKMVGRHLKTYENWRKDPKFKAEADRVTAAIKRSARSDRDPELLTLDFAEWRRRFLGMETYPHMQQWIDLLEGREPRDLHPAITYEPGNPRRILINTPPFHAKSTVITQQYVAYRICMNPEIRVVIVSKTQKQAAKYLYSVKRMLTERQFADLHAAYAPKDGFEGPVWTSTMIYVNGRGEDAIDPASKDPTVEAIGIGGQLQGARADLIILDDVEDPKNVAQWEAHLDWVNEVVQSRLYSGRILVVGTRVAAQDLSAALRDGDNFSSGKSPWTYLGQPCVLEEHDDPAEWVTLWPKSTVPLDVEDESKAQPDEHGLYPCWDGPALHEVREQIRPRSWALLYMQAPISDDSTFPMLCVNGSVNRMRKPGPMRPGEHGGRPHGPEGLHIIASIDPAGTQEGFVLVYAVDRASKERWVLNAWVSVAATPKWYYELLQQITTQYGIQELVIENQGYSSWLIHDENIVRYCQARGIRILPHYTSRNKIDPDFGVASMSPLFGTLTRLADGAGRVVHAKDNIIHLPDPGCSPGVKALVDQLIMWQPGAKAKKQRMDGPMALWFAETRVRQLVTGGDKTPTQFLENRYLSRRQQRDRYVAPAAHGTYFTG